MLPEEQQALRKIRRVRLWFCLFLVSYVPLLWLGMRLTHSDLATTLIMLLWLIALVHLVAAVAFSHCPRCGNYFHATTGTPSFWNLFARSCTHCGLPLRTGRVIYPSME
jgi:hypothetical protein